MSNNTPISYITKQAKRLIEGEVSVPPDKSISHRAIILGSLAIGDTRISNLLLGDDVVATMNAMRAMGVNIYQQDDDYIVEGNGLFSLTEPEDVINMGNSGTGVRLVVGLVSSLNMLTFFTGDHSLNKRPMKRIIEPLSQNGCQITARQDNLLPMSFQGIKRFSTHRIHFASGISAGEVGYSASRITLSRDTIVVEPTPTRDHSENMLIGMGAKLTTQDNTITLSGMPDLYGQHIALCLLILHPQLSLQ